ncbi:queuosine precursor transporter [Trueperella pecoris]|uniref:queuosine precursor transporter n=1 Tax=Trueperella pecoris TaxID=2733571 RepID=UPI00186BB14E|nr:queuosine precursor transporter [Trueperella pecoris]QOQ39745.1 queuosine precursor transporter [Trueperella pecoris]QTG75466.1 queuosine precursor transporter [Trueperella pecoris]
MTATSAPAHDAAPTTPVKYAPIRRGFFDYFVVFFVAFLLLSNISATKLVEVGPLTFDGGAVLFPLTYIIGDVLSEVYGFKAAKRAIFMGFVVSFMASLTFWLVIKLPAHPDYTSQAAFEEVLGVVWRFVVASLAGYLAGQLLNAKVLTYIKDRWGEKHMWARLIGSTVVGEFADTLIFCVIAWVGVMSWGVIFNLTVVGFIYKVAVEVVFLPLTYLVINLIKKYEPNYGVVNS